MTTYCIVRSYFEDGVRNNRRRRIKEGLTLEEAQEHCSDPETSSRTCTQDAGIEHTEKYGAWFDGFESEE